jgi:hypothetical protein
MEESDMPEKVTDVKAMLEAMDEEAEEVPARENQSAGIPDGKYQLAISAPSSGILVNQDSDGGTRARVVLEVVNAADDEVLGTKDSKSWTLVGSDGALNEMGVSILKTDLEVLGIPFTKLSEVDELLEKALGAVVNATVATKERDDRVYHNIYFNTLVHEGDAADTDDY